MIPDLAPINAILTFGIPVLILVMFLPAFLELKKSKQEKPRTMVDDISEGRIQLIRMRQIVNIESEQRLDNELTQPLAKIIGVLPNLEV